MLGCYARRYEAMRDVRMLCAMHDAIHDAMMRCRMVGCAARCYDAMRDARMLCAMLGCDPRY